MAATNHYYGWVEVNKSFYTTFNGRRFYCNVPELYLGSQQAKMRVKYRDGDEEYYSLKSSDGVLFSGTMGTDDDNRVDFELWKHDRICLFLQGIGNVVVVKENVY